MGARAPAPVGLEPGGSGARGAEPECDGAFEAIMWWSSADDGADNEGLSPLDLVPEEESDAASNACEEH